jgi:hypothetical protein
MVAQDVPMTSKAMVWGRFSVYRSQSFEIGNPNRFAQTGPSGVPYMMFHAMKRPQPTDDEVVQESSARLSAIFGDYFDAHDTYATLLAAKRRWLQPINTMGEGFSPPVAGTHTDMQAPKVEIIEVPVTEQAHIPLQEAKDNIETAGESVLNKFGQLTEEGAAAKFRQSLLQELDDPQLQHVQQLNKQIAILTQRLRNEGMSEALKTQSTIQGIEKDLFRMYGNAKARFDEITTMLRATEATDSVSVIGEGAREMAEQLLLQGAMYRSPDGKQRFIYSEHLPHIPEKGNKVTIHIKRDEEPIQVPVSSIVSPAEMESWEGRRGSDESARKIKDYSERDTDIPPIKDGVFGFIMPDGRIFFESQNAHRVAAAVKKGQEYIGVQGPIILTKIDYIPEALK